MIQKFRIVRSLPPSGVRLAAGFGLGVVAVPGLCRRISELEDKLKTEQTRSWYYKRQAEEFQRGLAIEKRSVEYEHKRRALRRGRGGRVT
eukprot:810480-Alexandrium_andersonii.AAC.1